MPRALIDPLYDTLREAYPSDRAYDADDWTDGPMPDALRHFLHHVLNHRRHVEVRRLREARSTWVAYDDEAVRAAAETFEATVQDHVRVPADEWEAILRQATRVVTTYLVRPVPTLMTFVFNDRDTPLPLDRVRWRMQFFGPYAYLHDAVETYAEHQSLSRLHPSSLQTFLARVDARAVSDDAPKQWVDLLDPLFDVARTALNREAVPTDLLQHFFEEKRASEIAQRLRDRAQAGHTHTDPDALRRLLGAQRTSDSASPVESGAPSTSKSTENPTSDPDAETQTDAEPAFLADISPPADDDADDDANDEKASRSDAASHHTARARSAPARTDPTDAPDPVESPSQTEAPTSPDPSPTDPDAKRTEERTDAPDRSADASEPDAAAPSGEEDEKKATPRWRQFQGTGPSRAESSEAGQPDAQTPLWARFKPSPSRDTNADASSLSPDAVDNETRALERHLLGSIPPSHRTAYVRQLFQGSVDDYRRTLERIRDATSWNEASNIIAKDIFQANQVNIYSDVAVHFTDAVEAHFRE